VSTSVESSGRAALLALIGDRYHNPDYIRLHLWRLAAAAEVELEYTCNYEWFSSGEATRQLLQGRQVFVVFRDGLIFPEGYVGPEAYSYYSTFLMVDPPSGAAASWVTEAFGEAVEEFVAAGGSLLSLHNNLSVSTYSTAYRRVTRGVYDGHPPERNWTVRVVAPGHELTEGVSDFVLTDEQHFPIYDGDPGDVLLMGENTDGCMFNSDSGTVQAATTSTVAWAHTHGAGKVVVSTIGHNLDALWKPSAFRFQLNALRWLLAPAHPGPAPAR
jgi:type 1 glutamine amidotransferase